MAKVKVLVDRQTDGQVKKLYVITRQKNKSHLVRRIKCFPSFFFIYLLMLIGEIVVHKV